MRDTTRFILVLLIAFAVASPRNADRATLAALAHPSPALELKKVVSFPLAGAQLPTDRDSLINAIADGLRGRVTLDPRAVPVIARGGNYPALDQLTVDLTDAAIDSGHPLPKLRPRGEIQPAVHAASFQFKADPMKVDGADIHLDITASDVDLGLQHDGHTGQPILILTQARDGQVRCDTTMQDLSQIFRASADFRGKPYGLRVQRANLKLISEDTHQLKADLRLGSRLMLLPIALHFTARVDVDDDGNAHLSHLTCDGDDVAGWLISGFIRPSLAQHNGRTMPLVAFPTDQIKLHDLRVQIDGDHVTVAGAFGG